MRSRDLRECADDGWIVAGAGMQESLIEGLAFG
jgi:hypothetical protein